MSLSVQIERKGQGGKKTKESAGGENGGGKKRTREMSRSMCMRACVWVRIYENVYA